MCIRDSSRAGRNDQLGGTGFSLCQYFQRTDWNPCQLFQPKGFCFDSVSYTHLDVYKRQTDGDMDKAVEFLREKGLAGAAKKAGRIAAEGIVDTAITEDGKKAVVVEVNAETDFVAKNAKFQAYVADVAAPVSYTHLDVYKRQPWRYVSPPIV